MGGSRTKVKSAPWTREDIRYVANEHTLALADRKSARRRGFHIGQRLDRILTGGLKYGKNLLANFLKGVEQQEKVIIAVQTGYRYLNLYRGAGTVENAVNLDVPQKYWEVLGKDRWGDDIFSVGLVQWFREHLLMSDPELGKPGQRKPDPDKLSQVVELLNAHRERLKAIAPDAETDLNAMAVGGIKKEDQGFTSREARISIEVVDAVNQFQYDLSLVAGEPVRTLPLGVSPRRAKRLNVNVDDQGAWLDIAGTRHIDIATKPHDAEMLKRQTSKGLARSRSRQAAEIEIISSSSKEQLKNVKGMLAHGDSREILATEWIKQGSIDMVLTDPPYGEYDPWRERTRIHHQSEGDPEANAIMVAKVASKLLERKLHAKRFVWLSFCPLDLIHIFAPPLLNAFAPLRPTYQVLTWDKAIKPKVGGIVSYSPQAEGILCLSVNRPLPTATPMSPIYIERQEAWDDTNWKPVKLLRRLIEDYSYSAGRKGQFSGQTVLDPFCGRGGVGVAAMFSGINAKLIEVDDDQHGCAMNNITSAMKIIRRHGSSQVAWMKYMTSLKSST